jgi:outer membrane protein assembly factor BamB
MGRAPLRPTRRRLLRGLAALAGLAGLSAASACANSPPAPVGARPAKPMYQMDPRHSGRSPFRGPRHLALLRRFDAGQVPLSDPAFATADIQSSAAVDTEGTIYIGLHAGILFALRDPGRGEQLAARWHFQAPGASSWHATPATGADGTVYLGFSTGGNTPEATGRLYALAAPLPRSGLQAQVVWSVDLGPGRQTSSPTLASDGTILVVSGAGTLFAVRPDGAVRWTARTGPSLRSAPALGPDGTVYLASMDGRLYAVAPPAAGGSEGAVRWAFDFGQHLGPTPLLTTAPPPAGADGIGSGASPTVSRDGMIYVGANNSNLYAIRPDGALAWLFEAEREVAGIWSTAALSPDERVLYFGANKGGLYAVDRADGALRWRFEVPGSIYNSPTLDAQGVLYTGSTVGHVFAVNAADGALVADFDAGAPVWAAPTIRADGTLVVADRTGRVLLLGEA